MEIMTHCHQADVRALPVTRALAPMALAKPWSVGDRFIATGVTFDGDTTVNGARRPPEAPS
jgi:hypothetical protein